MLEITHIKYLKFAQGLSLVTFNIRNMSKSKELSVKRSVLCTNKEKLATLSGHGRKRKLSTTATRFKTEKDLQEDLVGAGTEVSVCTIRGILNTESLHA